MKNSSLGISLLLVFVAACASTEPVKPPVLTQPIQQPLRGLGSVELNFSSIGSGLEASLVPSLSTQALSETGGLTYQSLSQGTFVKAGIRYLSATFKVIPSASQTNLTFIAEVKTGRTINDTAISRLKKFDGTDANPDIARSIKPTHGLKLIGAAQDSIGLGVQQADFQAFAETDLYSPTDGGYLLPYGFVAKTSTGTRVITPSNPGFVTFAFQMPSSGITDPYSLSVFLQAATDPTTRVTESQLEYQNGISSAEARALAVGASQVYKFPKSQLFLQAPNPTVICQVRTAGTAAAPLEQLFNLLPPVLSSTNPLTPAANSQNVARVAPIASINLDTSLANNSGTPVMHSSFQRYDDADVQSTGTGFSITPVRDYMAGELLEVSIPPSQGEGDCGANGYVYQYRSSSQPADALRARRNQTSAVRPYAVTMGDLNADGRLDLAVANFSDSISIYLQQADGSYSRTDRAVFASPRSIAIGDLNDDGRLDLAISNVDSDNLVVAILLQQADGSYSQTNLAVAGVARSIAIGDLNGDGKLDLAVATGADAVSVLRQQTNGSFSRTDIPVATIPTSVAIGDLNNDGRLDLAVSNKGSSSVSILLQQAGGSFSRTDTAVGSGPISVAMGDLNNDGRLDLVTTDNTNDSLYILQQQPDGSFAISEENLAFSGASLYSVAIGDLNGDDRPDLVTVDYENDSVYILLKEANGSFLIWVFSLATNAQPYSVAIGDLNNDGKLDLATSNSGGNVSTILSTTAQLNPSAVTLAPSGTQQLAQVDSTGTAVSTSYNENNFSSSNTNVASVTADGLVTAGSSNGTSNIQFYNGSAKSRIAVTNNPLLGAVDLGSNTDYLTVANNAALELGSNFTLEMWIKIPINYAPSSNVVILEKANSDGTGRYSYSLNLNSNRQLIFYRQTNNLLEFLTSNSIPNDGAWHYVAVTRSFTNGRAQINLYVNGNKSGTELVNTGVSNDTASNSQALSMSAKSDGTDNITMQIDEVRLWNESKDPSYFTATSRNNPVSTPYPPTLKAYFKMDLISTLKLTNEINPSLPATLNNMIGMELVAR